MDYKKIDEPKLRELIAAYLVEANPDKVGPTDANEHYGSLAKSIRYNIFFVRTNFGFRSREVVVWLQGQKCEKPTMLRLQCGCTSEKLIDVTPFEPEVEFSWSIQNGWDTPDRTGG